MSLLILTGPLRAQPAVQPIDYVYDPQIQTVLLYPLLGADAGNPTLTLNPPVTSLDEQTPLLLEFDDLTAQYRQFRARLVHCNANWQRSVLNDIEFTYEYNDYPITDYQVSQNTKIQYYHYRFPVPRVKLPGNYVLVVFDERNPRNVLFTRRFSLYSNRVVPAANVRFSTDPGRQFNDQQIDLTLVYKNYQVISPQDDFYVVIRQNYRDDRVITGLKPTNVRPFEQVLEYRLVDLRNTLPGGNEFRFFDTRTIFSRGNYIDRIERPADRNIAYVQTDRPRNRGAFLESDDFNGMYIIDQRETGNGATAADYIETLFTLNASELPGTLVYVNGAFTFWQLNDRNRMTYDPAQGVYRASLLLKQGVYNYAYAAAKPGQRVGTESLLEGDFSATENDYEVFVYHRPPASRADQLVGYLRLGVNRRR